MHEAGLGKNVWSRCRPLALSQLAIGVSTGLLMVTSRAETLLLFAGRAASMGSFAILYVYTPEVCPSAHLSNSIPLNTQCRLSELVLCWNGIFCERSFGSGRLRILSW